MVICFYGFHGVCLSNKVLGPGLSCLGTVVSLKLTSYVGRVTVTVIRVMLGGVLHCCKTGSMCKDSVPVTYMNIVSGIGVIFVTVYVNVSRNDRPV